MDRSLYERLGGADGIRSITRDAVHNHLNNPIVKARFANADADKLIELAHAFFCAGTGGPEKYAGREMRAAHQGMNISEQEYMAVLDDILAALDKHGIARADRDEVLGVLYSLKTDIVRV